MAAKPREKGERLGRLEELRARETALMEELAAGGVKGVLAVQREIRRELEHVPEHVVPEDRELTLEDVERWCESRFWKFASTMPTNPHSYTIKDWGDPDMFERVCLYLWDNGYANVFGGREFTQLDVGDHFIWSTQHRGDDGRDTTNTTLINRKLLSLLVRNPPSSRWRPTKQMRAKAAIRRLGVGEVLTLNGTPVRVERRGVGLYLWATPRGRVLELDAERAIQRLAGCKVEELDGMRFSEAVETPLFGGDGRDGEERG